MVDRDLMETWAIGMLTKAVNLCPEEASLIMLDESDLVIKFRELGIRKHIDFRQGGLDKILSVGNWEKFKRQVYRLYDEILEI